MSSQPRDESGQPLTGTERPATYLDAPERSSRTEILRIADTVARTPLVKDLIEAYPSAVVMLDENRQIVAFNRRCLPYFGGRDPGSVYGLRLGEAIECVHADTMDAGCGTSLFCRDCGAAAAIKTVREADRATSRECRITVSRDGRDIPFDLRVHASSIRIEDHRLVFAAIEDIADEKRRAAFERIFFHDVLNTASAVSHSVRLLPLVKEPGRLEEVVASLTRSSSQLLDEIRAQRDLLNAERGELVVTREPVSANSVLDTVRDVYAALPLCEGKRIVLERLVPDAEVSTDVVQVVRCLGNLVKNALEASAAGGEVRLSAAVGESTVAFHVANAGSLSEPVRRQMFQRSFSTKGGRGRGIGTYSVKLLVEHYLGGAVRFTSTPERQTVFTIELPRATAKPAHDLAAGTPARAGPANL